MAQHLSSTQDANHNQTTTSNSGTQGDKSSRNSRASSPTTAESKFASLSQQLSTPASNVLYDIGGLVICVSGCQNQCHLYDNSTNTVIQFAKLI